MSGDRAAPTAAEISAALKGGVEIWAFDAVNRVWYLLDETGRLILGAGHPLRRPDVPMPGLSIGPWPECFNAASGDPS